MEYNQRLGKRLRNVRNELGLSLGGVAKLTDRDFKPSIIGAYERGERAITVRRLSELCRAYRVDIRKVLPSDEDDIRGRHEINAG